LSKRLNSLQVPAA